VSARILVVSAIASGQGKTTATAALARHRARAGERVRVFKIGADFIDPLLLERASGHGVESLDLWMVGNERCAALLAAAAAEADTVLVEGAMGLYDGSPSAADLATAFQLPVLAVLDVHAMAETAGAVARGLRDHGPVRLAGVLANGVAGAAHREMVRGALGDIPLLGSLPKLASGLPERHLGLVLPAEVDDLEGRLGALTDALVLDAAAWAGIAPIAIAPYTTGAVPTAAPLAGRTIAIARDAAFAFLYPSNVACLEALGARIAWFSPLADERVPDAAQAVLLPGGYPELHGAALAGATRFHASVRAAVDAGTPVLAECGGLMALTDALVDLEGRRWPMAGVLAGTARMTPRLAGLGLQAWDTGRGMLRGHAFHHSTLDTPLAPSAHTLTHPRGTRGEAVYRQGSLTASYFHAYFASCPEAVAAIFRGELAPGCPARDAGAV
jgi:cobyrinic acid a,c-diamide synthase